MDFPTAADALDRLLITSQQIADIARLTARSDGKLIFDPFPTDPLDHASCFDSQSLRATATVLKVKNSHDKTEQISFSSIYLIGWRLDPTTAKWQLHKRILLYSQLIKLSKMP